MSTGTSGRTIRGLQTAPCMASAIHDNISIFNQSEEANMNIVDMMIHIHPELDENTRANLTRKLEAHVGVDCAEFDQHPHPHALIVKYDPDAVQSKQILAMVRKIDSLATMVGM